MKGWNKMKKLPLIFTTEERISLDEVEIKLFASYNDAMEYAVKESMKIKHVNILVCSIRRYEFETPRDNFATKVFLDAFRDGRKVDM